MQRDQGIVFFATSIRLLRCWPHLLSVIFLGSLAAQETILVPTGAEWKYWKGTAAPPPGWREEDFDDSDWPVGPTGIGYGDNDDTTILSDMQNGYLTVFVRHELTIADPGAITTLALRVTHDDGFVAYLNETEIGRANVADADPTEATAASATIEPVQVTVIVPPNLLKAGRNTLAASVHNAALASSDLSFIPELVVDPDNCPRVITCSHVVGKGTTLTWMSIVPYDSITVRRNGGDLETSLDGALQTYIDPDPPLGDVTYQVIAIDGGKPCAPLECKVVVTSPEDVLIGTGELWRFLRGSTALPLDWNLEGFDDSGWEAGPTGIGYGDQDDATELLDMRQISDDLTTPDDEFQPGYAVIFCRKTFQIPTLEGIQGFVFSAVYDDGFVAYLNGQEIGRANMPPDPVTEFTFALTAIDPGAPLQITVPASLARAGENLLAVSVHNASLTSSDLSFIPFFSRMGATPAGPQFRRGDADDSRLVNITDAVYLLRSLFQGGDTPRCQDAADVDDSGTVSITDAVFLLRSLFQGGDSPPAPGTICGPDPSVDVLPACGAASC